MDDARGMRGAQGRGGLLAMSSTSRNGNRPGRALRIWRSVLASTSSEAMNRVPFVSPSS